MNDLSAARPEPRVSRRQLARVGIALTLIVLVLASVRFARYDWTGVRLDLLPDSIEREVSADCYEDIGTFVTDTGRIVGPVAVDDEQYMSLVAMYRGTPRGELQSECLYTPYVGRFAQPFLASLLPMDEAAALATTNVLAMVVAVWAMLLALRAQGVSPRVLVTVGLLFALNWNTLLASSVIMTDSGILAAMTIGWWLVASRRLWAALLFVALAIPIRETVLALVPVLLAAGYQQYGRDRDLLRYGAYAVTCVCVPVAAFLGWSLLAVGADANWGSTPRLSVLLFNLGTPSVVTVLLAGVPLYLPAYLRIRDRARADGLATATTEPAAVGVLIATALCLWALASADMSPRFLWVGFPFAAALTAEWLGRGHLRSVMDRLAPERLAGGSGVPEVAGAGEPPAGRASSAR